MWIWSLLPAINLLMITFKIMFKWVAEWLFMIWSLPLSSGHSFSRFLLLSIESLGVPSKIWDYKLNFSFRWKKNVLVQVCSQYWMRHMKILFFVYLKFRFHWASCMFIWYIWQLYVLLYVVSWAPAFPLLSLLLNTLCSSLTPQLI